MVGVREIGAERLCEGRAGRSGAATAAVGRASVGSFRAVGDSDSPFSNGTPIRALPVSDRAAVGVDTGPKVTCGE